MRIISIDIGIKNLAYCILDISDNPNNSNNTNNVLHSQESFTIIKWDVINLCGENAKCNYKKKDKKSNIIDCKRQAKYYKENEYVCSIHSKQKNLKYIIPDNYICKLWKNIENNKTISMKDIEKVFDLLNLSIDKNIISDKTQKEYYKEIIKNKLEEKYYKEIATSKANEMSLIDIGKCIHLTLHTHIPIETIDKVIIENQISPIANRMKTLQGMITQYFIMNNIFDIEFISSKNKLKDFTDEKLDYKERKTKSIEITNTILSNDLYKKWSDLFHIHKKKDDLADCLLQGIWYIKHRIK